MKSPHVENLRNAKSNDVKLFVNLRTVLFISCCLGDILLIMRCSPYSSKIAAKIGLFSSAYQVQEPLFALWSLMRADMAIPLL